MPKTTSKQATPRHRNWIFIVYPDSAPENWRDIVTDTGASWGHSPLHDKDENEYGGAKKPHYHCLIKFNSLKSYRQMLSITGKLHAPNPQPCESIVGKVRYWLHLDNPEKYQYEQEDIKAFNGLDIKEILRPSKTEQTAMMREARAFIRENNIKELKDFMDYADKEKPEWGYVINKYHCGIRDYINSSRYSSKHQQNEEYEGLRLVRTFIKENGIIEIANVYDFLDETAPQWGYLMETKYLEIKNYLESTIRRNKHKVQLNSLDTPKQTNIIPLVPKGIDLDLWELTIKEYQESCL
ncbi:replication protein [Enterococcus faecalis]|uniref:Replication protein n=1 Tax=Enterococcus faecalis ATCC 6055 TaxID=1169311 RepID=R3L1C4_ENTFL|nr:replication protein [Enterococcus faecalis]EOK14524.1 hypothetical protein WOU_00949 [Enterococcus faecalis ATCC 6055]